jgi:PilZ domain
VRKANRTVVDEPARLHPNEWSSLEVRLLDCSQDGFRVECEARVRIGDLVTLDVPGIGPSRAQVSWCRERELGARFLDPIPFDRASVKPADSETVLARLLIQRAAAHRARLRDVERDLRRQIIETLPIRRG